MRHSLATDMLRRGASRDEIWEVLRHKSPDTTAIYAKVDLNALKALALPWPGVCDETVASGRERLPGTSSQSWLDLREYAREPTTHR